MEFIFLSGAILIALAIVGAVILQGIREIPASPPHVALVTLFKKPIEYVKPAGYRFFFGYPYIFGYIPIKIEKINDDDLGTKFEIVVRTPHPDNVEVRVTIHFTIQPDYKTPASVIRYIESGQAVGAGRILIGIIEQELREWASSKEKGPKNWQELISSDEEASNVIIDAIISSESGKIDSIKFPSSVLIKCMRHKSPSLIEEEKYGKNWEKIQEYLNSLSETERKELEEKVVNRAEEIAKIKDANGFFGKPSIGIILNRLNIGEMRLVNEDLSKAAESQAKEERERDAEKVEMEHVKTEIQKLVDAGFTKEEAKELFQTERAKITKNVSEHKLSITPETQGMIKDVLPLLPFLQPVKGKKKGGGK